MGEGTGIYDLSFTALVSMRKQEFSRVTHTGVTLWVRGSSRSSGCFFSWPNSQMQVI